MQLFLQRLFDALSNGAVYAALAVALSMVFRSSSLLNFGLGEMSMAATFLALELTSKPSPMLRGTMWLGEHLGTPWNVWVAIPVVVVVAMFAGTLVERIFVRRLEKRSALAVVSMTLGIGMFFAGGANQMFAGRFYSFPTPFPQGADATFRIRGAFLRYETIGTVAVLVGTIGALGLLQRRTKLGLAFRAVASNRDGAALVGVPVNRVLAIGWGIAGGIGALAGMLVANNVLVSASMMTRLLVFALAAATVGGLDSPAGAAVGGLVLALLETMLGGYVPSIGGDMGIVVAIGALVLMLYFRPSGLFGRKQVSRL